MSSIVDLLRHKLETGAQEEGERSWASQFELTGELDLGEFEERWWVAELRRKDPRLGVMGLVKVVEELYEVCGMILNLSLRWI